MKKLIYELDYGEGYGDSKRDMDQAYLADKVFILVEELCNRALRRKNLEYQLESKFKDKEPSQKEWDYIFDTMEFVLDKFYDELKDSGIPDDLF